MIYFIADTHFGDPKIISYCHRPFSSLEDMTNKLINNWNNKVKEDDVVIVLGDLSLYDLNTTKDIVSRLNGCKILVTGNHDKYSREEYIQCGFLDVFKDDFIIENKDDDILPSVLELSHKPQDTEHFDIFNIHGHIHDEPLEKQYPKLNKENHFCVSVEMTNYEPISIEEIRNKIKGED